MSNENVQLPAAKTSLSVRLESSILVQAIKEYLWLIEISFLSYFAIVLTPCDMQKLHFIRQNKAFRLDEI